jgi:hypothetical protein
MGILTRARESSVQAQHQITLMALQVHSEERQWGSEWPCRFV